MIIPASSTPLTRRLRHEVSRRRTFAIISHPDAGKTTLTEKLLLYAGAIQTAGMVRGRKTSQATASDWLEIERERGISVTSSAMQVPYKDAVITILDTPGHNDFCEDTYRALMAADSAVMVIDGGKGVELQTRKLFAVCRRRGIPILTFINKLDLHALEPLELLTHVEEVLEIDAAAMNWPVGGGRDFQGVVDRDSRELVLFSPGGGAARRHERRLPLDGDEAVDALGAERLEEVVDELDLLEGAGNPFDRDRFLAGELTPVFFGSALTNFGVEDFFDAFVDLAPAPGAREARKAEGEGEVRVDPVEGPFSAFVFKIQANMNPRHRDSMAFLRVCSGRFERDMVVRHHRTGKPVRLARPYATFARDRETVEEAFPGDVLGIVNPGVFAIGDTVSLEGGFDYEPLPQLAPTFLGRIRPKDVGGRKSFDKGLDQLVQEGAVQLVELLRPRRERVLAAVGRLQFDVIQHRLRQEYNCDTVLSVDVFETSAWLQGDPDTLTYSSAVVAVDPRGRHLALFRSELDSRAARRISPELVFTDVA